MDDGRDRACLATPEPSCGRRTARWRYRVSVPGWPAGEGDVQVRLDWPNAEPGVYRVDACTQAGMCRGFCQTRSTCSTLPHPRSGSSVSACRRPRCRPRRRLSTISMLRPSSRQRRMSRPGWSSPLWFQRPAPMAALRRGCIHARDAFPGDPFSVCRARQPRENRDLTGRQRAWSSRFAATVRIASGFKCATRTGCLKREPSGGMPRSGARPRMARAWPCRSSVCERAMSIPTDD